LNKEMLAVSGLPNVKLITRNNIWYDIYYLLTFFRLGIMYRYIVHVSQMNYYTNLASKFLSFGNILDIGKYGKSAKSKQKEFSFYGIKLTDEDSSEDAVIIIQHWWRNLIETGKVDLTKKERSMKNFGVISMRRMDDAGGLLLNRQSSKGMFRRSFFNSENILDENIEHKSQIGRAMQKLTCQRVAMGFFGLLCLSVIFTCFQDNSSKYFSMMILHKQSNDTEYSSRAIAAARSNTLSNMYKYTFANGTMEDFEDRSFLREKDICVITVEDYYDGSTSGYFDISLVKRNQAIFNIIMSIFIMVLWLMSNLLFSGPVTILVIVPIERVIQLLRMLMKDPLGFQNSIKFRTFAREESKLVENTAWTSEVLQGMETAFLMSGILRICSLLKIGFGTAGVDIIRRFLKKQEGQDPTSILYAAGSLCSCVFLFCDIRQFTDATECLQEEVFVFTNKVASIVHSICSAYGGSANKNIGDAFLMSWQVYTNVGKKRPIQSRRGSLTSRKSIVRKPNQKTGFGFVKELSNSKVGRSFSAADKALAAVIKIICALYHDKFFLDALGEKAKNRLLEKLANRPGPIVQMGMGLHFGEAVVGAIGSQRKIDATYLSENVEMAEYLESSTKKYSVRMLYSSDFYKLLNFMNQNKSRKIDQVCLHWNEIDKEDYLADSSLHIENLYTLDLDVEALWQAPKKKAKSFIRKTEVPIDKKHSRSLTRTRSDRSKSGDSQIPSIYSENIVGDNADDNTGIEEPQYEPPKLFIPTSKAVCKEGFWQEDDMVKMREKYNSFPKFFELYKSGLRAFYSKDWKKAQRCFLQILEVIEDGPSRYFLKKIEANYGVPPSEMKAFATE